jgi:branched-chain amino acid aminotransferase
MSGMVYVDGDVLPDADAKISVHDHGLLYGDGLFEAMRAYGVCVFRLGRHLDRMLDSAPLIHLAIPWSRDELADAVARTLDANGLADARVRMMVTRGADLPGQHATEAAEPSLIVTAHPLSLPSPERYAEGFSAIIASERRDTRSVLSRIKSINGLARWLSQREAEAAGADDAIALNERGDVAEAATANIFVVRQGLLATPDLDAGILPGVTREAVIACARELGIDVEERTVRAQELRDADECFVTSSVREVRAIVRLNGRPIGAGSPGPVTEALAGAYSSLVRAETRRAESEP